MPCSLWNISFQHLLSITNKIEWRLSLFNLNIWAPTNNKSITLLIINHLLRKLAKRRFISSSLSGGHQLYKLAQFNWIQIFYGKQLHCARGLLFFFKCPFNSFVISINPRERTSDFSQSFSIRLASLKKNSQRTIIVRHHFAFLIFLLLASLLSLSTSERAWVKATTN